MEKSVQDTHDSVLFDYLEDSMTETFIFMNDMKKDLTRISKNAVDFFALPGEYIEEFDKVWIEKIYPEDRQIFLEDFQGVLNDPARKHDCQYRIMNFEGKYVWVSCKGRMCRDDAGVPLYFIGTITQLGVNNMFDPNTGLMSLQRFRMDLEIYISKKNLPAALLMLGIDNFSRVNSQYGFSGGDRVLQILGNIIERCLPEKGQLYKMDGDKFMTIIPGAPRGVVDTFFDDVNRELADTRLLEEYHLTLTLSGGATKYPDDGDTVDDLQRAADYALETAKGNGKRKLSFYNGEFMEKKLRKLEILSRLQTCIQNDFQGFVLNFQPLVNDNDERVLGSEALLRWYDGDRKVSPAEFIPILEESGDIKTVGRWVFDQAMEQLEHWMKKDREFVMAVNVSYLQFEEEFVDYIIKTVQRREVSPGNVIIELTESCNVSEPEALSDMVLKLRTEGIHFAMDDFGTEYAALHLLRVLSADMVKIDHNFVSKITTDLTDQAIIKHIIALCHELGILVVVEGIETTEIEKMVRIYEPEFLQGYYYSVPVPADEFEERFLPSK